MARFEHLFDQAARRIDEIDELIERHGGPIELRDKVARAASELVDGVNDVLANLNAVDGEVVEPDPDSPEAERADRLREEHVDRTWTGVLVIAAAVCVGALLVRRILR
jgi:hypothetical protein